MGDIGLMDKIKNKVMFVDMISIKDFVKDMNEFPNDVNIYCGHKIFDAKSIVGMMNFQLGKVYEVEIVSNNYDIQCRFAKVVSKYRG